MPENRKDPCENTDADKRHPTIINANRQTHGDLRKLLSNAFSDKVMKGQEHILLHYIDLLIERLQETCKDDQPMDIVRWYNVSGFFVQAREASDCVYQYVTFDIIGHLAFDEPFDCLKNTDYHPWMSMIFNAIKYVHYIRSLQRFFDARALILRIMPQKVVERRRWHIGLVEEKVKRRMTRNPDYVDFMTHLIQAQEKGRLELPDLVANANLMVIAGSETTATILSGTTYHLLTHPDVMKKLTEEVRTSFNSPDEINIEQVSKLSYIHGVLNESFRLYPPAAGSHPRITPPEGAQILGDWLPGNVSPGHTKKDLDLNHNSYFDTDIHGNGSICCLPITMELQRPRCLSSRTMVR